jgi:anion-transporting  ArsA/GET3 family ATPase
MAKSSKNKTKPRLLEDLLPTKEVIIACGPGGVGKTTTAAATALTIALNFDKSVLVLTIDPAKRLANALGLNGIGNKEIEVNEDAFREAKLKPKGKLSVAMLDTKESWDALIKRHAKDQATVDQILSNPLYKNITSKFVQSHEYIAMERLYDLHSSKDYDVIVVDTPPTRNALDFLDAPDKMADFFSSRLLKWLIAPYKSKLISLASKPFYQIADRVLGNQFLQDIAEFFIAFQSMYDGFVQRAESVKKLLADTRTSFFVVSTLEQVPALEARFFVDELQKRSLNLDAIILNKVLPESFRSKATTEVAKNMQDMSDVLSQQLENDKFSALIYGKVLNEIAASFLNFQKVAQQEASLESEFSDLVSISTKVPFYSAPINDLGALEDLGKRLWLPD